MLKALFIEQFAIVSRLELDFSLGMSAFTGETGAGKSIMIDALLLALGERADASVVRTGADKCEIHAHFSFDVGSMPEQWLLAHDLYQEPGEVVVRRIIFAEGRSKSYINDKPCSLYTLKELSELLVDIHGQHQHQRLLNHITHREQLDNYAKHDTLLKDVAEQYHKCKQLQQELAAIKQQQTHNALESLQTELAEISALNLQDNELDALHKEHQQLHYAKDHLQAVQLADDLLNGDAKHAIKRQLHQLLHTVATLPQDNAKINNAVALLQNAIILCDEAIHEIITFADSIILSPERLAELEDRMSTIHHIARKYHLDAHQLLMHQQKLEQQIASQATIKQREQQYMQDYAAANVSYQQAAAALTASRAQHAISLSSDITKIIQQLGMPFGEVFLQITPLTSMQLHGQDKVEYYVCTNPGMRPDTLSKIASGGELSRISLAIQLITAKRGATPTLLFDEVDVGIGGSTAALVGQLLQQLGSRLQIFCVTHQPQVAAAAHNHFRVEKHSDSSETFSTIYKLSPTERIDEIARMLAGLTLTPQSRLHAQALLNQSHASAPT